jgi:hypothetical protein
LPLSSARATRRRHLSVARRSRSKTVRMRACRCDRQRSCQLSIRPRTACPAFLVPLPGDARMFSCGKLLCASLRAFHTN